MVGVELGSSDVWSKTSENSEKSSKSETEIASKYYGGIQFHKLDCTESVDFVF